MYKLSQPCLCNFVCSTWGVPQMFSFLILSIMIAPSLQSFCMCHHLETVHHTCSHHHIVKLPFDFCFCHKSLLALISTHSPSLFFTFFVDYPFLWIVDPGYKNSSTFTTSIPCNFSSYLHHARTALMLPALLPFLLVSCIHNLPSFSHHICQLIRHTSHSPYI